MSIHIVKCKKTYLKTPLSTSASSVVLRELKDSKGTNVAMASFGAWGVVVLKQGDTIEMIKFTNISTAADDTATLTVASSGRNLNPTTPYAGAATGNAFQSGAEAIITNDPLTVTQFGNINNAQTWAALQTFTLAPISSADATLATELVRKSQLDAAVLGSVTLTPVVVPGTAGETLAIDQLVYLKASDGKWWLCDADTAATVENVQLGITRSAGVTGAAITNGVTIGGMHEAASAIFTANTKYYASNTAGGFSTSAGTKEVTIGFAHTTTQFYMLANYDQQITEDEQDALAGDVGTPSASNPFATADSIAAVIARTPTGIISPYAGFTAPSGWLLADGSAVNRTTYATLFSVLNPSLGTVTMTIASPAVATLTTHGLVLDDIIYFATTGALPTGVTANTRYYVISAGLTADEFEFSASKGGAAVNTSGSQSGVHTLRRSPYGVGDGSTTFNVPNLKGSVAVGRDSTQTEFNAVGETGGEKTHILTIAEMAAHTHSYDGVVSSGSSDSVAAAPGTVNSLGLTTGSTGSDTAHNNLQPYIALNYIIKT